MSAGAKTNAVKRRKVGFSEDVSPISCYAKDCLKVHLVLTAQDLHENDEDRDDAFDTEFSERIFGEDGKIYGYKDLKIDLWLHSATFQAYVQIQYQSKSAGGKKSCTDVFAKLKEVFGDSLTDDQDLFCQSLSAYSQGFKQMLTEHAQVLKSWRSDSSSASVSEGQSETSAELKQIVHLELNDPDVRAWHARLMPLALLFIEGAQPIRSDDPLWEVYVALEGEGSHLRVVGFCNVYRFYHYPDSTRLRISQILVLPPYQGNGYGLSLLGIVNEMANQRNCYDVTMEEPSLTLQKLRDTMDTLRLLSLPFIKAAVETALMKLHSKKLEHSGNKAEVLGLQKETMSDEDSPAQNPREAVKETNLFAPPPHLVEEVRKQLRVSKMEFRRCWEQILFMYLDPDDRDLQDVFREALVQRLSLEIFDKENKNKGVDKKIVDTYNQYDSSKTFVMMRARKRTSVAGPGCSSAPLKEISSADSNGLSAVTPAPEEKGKVLQEELKFREEELQGVAVVVARHCRSLGLSLPTLEIWEQGSLGQ